MKEKKEIPHGGKRLGAGRPKKEATVTLSFRVAADRADVLRQKIWLLLARKKK